MDGKMMRIDSRVLKAQAFKEVHGVERVITRKLFRDIEEEKITVSELIKILKTDIEKNSNIQLPPCETLKSFSESLIKAVQNLIKKNEKLKEIAAKIKDRLKDMKNKVKSLHESLQLTEVPETAKKIEIQSLHTRNKPVDIKIERNMEKLSEDPDSLILELQILENRLKDSKCKPKKIVSRILLIKNKLSELNTKKVIKKNRELSQKVRRGLENIEKSWIINENRSLTPMGTERFNNSSGFASPLTRSYNKYSPTLSKATNSSEINSEISQDENIAKFILTIKQKEEALDLLTEAKRSKESELDKIISSYKGKMFDLQQEKDQFLQIKAKVFDEVKKLKKIEENLKTREKNLKTGGVKEEDEEDWIEFKKCEKALEDSVKQINLEFKNIYREKEEICKIKSLLGYKVAALSEVWEFIKSGLKDFKDIDRLV